MLKLLFLQLIVFALLGTCIIARESPSIPSSRRKTLLILSSKGGGGHLAATSTLKNLLEDEYDMHVMYPIDQLRIWGVASGEQIYNSMLQSGWTRSLNFIVRHVVPPIFKNREDKMEALIDSSINLYKPDLIISLIPFVNYPASEAARKRDIPYLLVTTDNDLRHWVLRLEKLKHPDFKVTIGSDLTTSRQVLLKKNIPEHAIEIIGLPLRPEFIVRKDEAKIREEFGIPENKPVILVMIGGAGGEKAHHYAKKIGQMDLSAHLLVVMGKDDKMKKQIEKIELHPSNSITLFGFTDRIADLMSISHVIVTKSGPGTMSEAIAMKLPMLIDNTGKLLFWERINVELVLKYGIGQRITHHRQIQELLEIYLHRPEIKEQLQNSFCSIPPNHFHLKIKGIIEEMIANRRRQPVMEEVGSNLSLTQAQAVLKTETLIDDTP